MLTWDDVRQKTPLWLNLGGKSHCHPHPHFQYYVSVDSFMESEMPDDGWIMKHDVTNPISLPDNSVDRMLSEHMLHYLEPEDIAPLLQECHRILKPGGLFRIAVPDYGSPKDRKYGDQKNDSRYPFHKILTRKSVVDSWIEQSPFSSHEYFAYWDDDNYIQHTIDYSLGFVCRTPDNDERCKTAGLKTRIKNAGTTLIKGFRMTPMERKTLPGQQLYSTSLVVDLLK